MEEKVNNAVLYVASSAGAAKVASLVGALVLRTISIKYPVITTWIGFTIGLGYNDGVQLMVAAF